MKKLKDRQTGLLYGSYCADALSLGVHWIYDTDELTQKHGRITHYKAPGAILTIHISKRGIRDMWVIKPYAC
ncbi:MAG: hypothetical protein ACJZ7A_04715 [Opitutales bacterium]